jgi:hypothetical protein
MLLKIIIILLDIVKQHVRFIRVFFFRQALLVFEGAKLGKMRNIIRYKTVNCRTCSPKDFK